MIFSLHYLMELARENLIKIQKENNDPRVILQTEL